MSTSEPVEHNKHPNRIIYFGTDGCVGHYPLGINFTLSEEEYKDSKEIDRIITDEVLDENTGTFLRYLSDGVPYTCYGVPYSPDDERPGSKTIVLVEYGTVQEVKDAILQNPFLLDKFKKVKEKYKLNYLLCQSCFHRLFFFDVQLLLPFLIVDRANNLYIAFIVVNNDSI